MTTRQDAIDALTGTGAPFELEDKQVDGIPWRVFKNAPPSLVAVLESTRPHGDRTFLVYKDDRISFAEHLALVAGLAHELASTGGVGKGDRVAIGMRNYPEWVIAFWATQVLGAIAVPLNAWWTGPELAYAMQDSGAKAIVMDGERVDRLAPHLGELDLRLQLVVRHGGPVPEGRVRWEELRAGFDPQRPLPDVVVQPDDPSTILYTSGTTGLPKGALATHRNHCTNIMNTMMAGAIGAAMRGTPPPADPPPLASLQIFPFFHIGGLSGLYVMTALGGKLVTMYKWDTEEALQLLEDEDITATAMVPTLLRSLLDSPSLTSRHLDRLSGISSGGAPVPPDLIRTMESTFDARVAPGNGYGLTETTSAVIINSGDEYFAHPDSIGRVTVVSDLRIVDGAGDDVPTGEVGELWVRGPNVVKGYWNRPEATAESFTEGWFHTGDLGRIDEEGFVYIVDRLKDVVIRAGENVYCAEVEAVLFEHPDVTDVAIVGLPHEALGEEVVAVIQQRPGATATAADLQRFCAERMARFKVPSLVVFRGEPLPRTATGKVLKRELRDELKSAVSGS